MESVSNTPALSISPKYDQQVEINEKQPTMGSLLKPLLIAKKP